MSDNQDPQGIARFKAVLKALAWREWLYWRELAVYGLALVLRIPTVPPGMPTALKVRGVPVSPEDQIYRPVRNGVVISPTCQLAARGFWLNRYKWD